MCEEFFDDLEFLVDGASGAGSSMEFQQVVYKPIEYPSDPPLSFKTLPKHGNWEVPELITSERDEYMVALKATQFTLGVIQSNYKDIFKLKEEETSTYCQVIPQTFVPAAATWFFVTVPDPATSLCRAIVTSQRTFHFFILWAVKLG